MTYEQIAEMMEEMGLPFAYHHFAEGESPAPPFLLFLSPGENTFSADNLAYFSCKQLDIELYTDKKLPELEEQVEAVLSCGLFSFKGFCKSLFQIGFDFSQVVSRPLHCEAENLLLFRVSEIAGIVFERFLP